MQASQTHYWPLLTWILTLSWIGTCFTANAASIDAIPKSVITSLDRNQIPRNAISISVVEIEAEKTGRQTAKPVLAWRAQAPMNPASAMKLLTTLSGLDILGPQYRWRTNV